jgi:hypothetical protein
MLLVVIVMIALPIGWWVNRGRGQRRVADAIRAAGGWVTYDHEYIQYLKGNPGRRSEPSAPRWLRSVLGDDLFQDIAYVNLVYDVRAPGAMPIGGGVRDDRLTSLISQLPRLWEFTARDGQVTDAGMGVIARSPSLARLELLQPHVTDTGIELLRGNRQIARITISNALSRPPWGLTDRSLAAFASMPNLVELNLVGHCFSDGGRELLQECRSLRRFTLRCTPTTRGLITDEGIEALARISTLKHVAICDSDAGLAGFIALARLPKLKSLDCTGGHLTTNDVQALRAAMPGVTVTGP